MSNIVRHKPPFYCPAEVVGVPGVQTKKTYETRQEAQTADPRAKPYLCKTCGKWHLTTRRKR